MNEEPAPHQVLKNQSSFAMAISGVAILLGISMLFILNNQYNPPQQPALPVATTTAVLIVPAQIAKDAVRIERVSLPQAGFLAVRAIDKDRLGQIVEISRYLTAGTHSDITISLGDFYEGGEELIVMAYEDTGSDQTFNDLDQPLTIHEVPLAAYVSSGAVVPASIVINNANADTPHIMGGTAMATVRYTDTGFEPVELAVPVGAMVQFVNQSTKQMWVASNEHPAHSILPTFDQFQTGDQYVYVFDTDGAWEYHDHLNPTAGGVVTVTARELN